MSAGPNASRLRSSSKVVAGSVAALVLTACGGPDVDARIELVEDAIAAPTTIAAGRQVWEVTNGGDAHHNLTICRSDRADACVGGELLDWEMLARPTAARDPDFYADAGESLTIGKDWTTTVAYEFTPGTYRLYCAIIGHAEAGMQTALTVTE